MSEQEEMGASPSSGDRATQASPQAPAGLGHPVSVPSAADAHRQLKDAEANVSAIWTSYDAAKRAVEREWEPKLVAAKAARSAASRAYDQAVAAETPDHELHGEPVFRIEKITERWSRKVIGENRVEGIIETYRPGADMGRGYRAATNLRPGEPYVRLLKKDGKPGTKTERYQALWGADNPWQLASAMSARSDETPQEAQSEGRQRGRQSRDAQ